MPLAVVALLHRIWNSVPVKETKPTAGSHCAYFCKPDVRRLRVLRPVPERGSPSSIRGSANFSGHQRFFDNNDDEELMQEKRYDDEEIKEEKRYDEIIRHLDEEGVFSTEQRREIFYKYEQLYNALMTRPVFTELSRKQIQIRYAQYILPGPSHLISITLTMLKTKIAFITIYTFSCRKNTAHAGRRKKRCFFCRSAVSEEFSKRTRILSYRKSDTSF